MRDGYTKKEYEACENYIRNVQKMLLYTCDKSSGLLKCITSVKMDDRFKWLVKSYDEKLVKSILNNLGYICIRSGFLNEETRMRIISKIQQRQYAG